MATPEAARQDGQPGRCARVDGAASGVTSSISTVGGRIPPPTNAGAAERRSAARATKSGCQHLYHRRRLTSVSTTGRLTARSPAPRQSRSARPYERWSRSFGAWADLCLAPIVTRGMTFDTWQRRAARRVWRTGATRRSPRPSAWMSRSPSCLPAAPRVLRCTGDAAVAAEAARPPCSASSRLRSSGRVAFSACHLPGVERHQVNQVTG